jgi:hypothetical protein
MVCKLDIEKINIENTEEERESLYRRSKSLLIPGGMKLSGNRTVFGQTLESVKHAEGANLIGEPLR